MTKPQRASEKLIMARLEWDYAMKRAENVVCGMSTICEDCVTVAWDRAGGVSRDNHWFYLGMASPQETYGTRECRLCEQPLRKYDWIEMINKAPQKQFNSLAACYKAVTTKKERVDELSSFFLN